MSPIWGIIPTGISAGVALISAVVAAVSAIRSRKARAEADQLAKDATKAAIQAAEAQQQAADAAGRSADSESRAAAAVERLAAVHEEQARRQAEERDAAAGHPPWHLERQNEFNVLLHNLSPSPRFHVTATGEQVRSEHSWDRIERGEPRSVRVLAGNDATPDVVVTWYDSEVKVGQLRRWDGVPR
jgi:hypothetical protein